MTPARRSHIAEASDRPSLAAQQLGLLGVECIREELGITVSYWRGLEATGLLKRNAEHFVAQKAGQEAWYLTYTVKSLLLAIP
ncbi:MAG: hypothetical protein NVSMB6_06830 [Burkholderiaceae bacterium]